MKNEKDLYKLTSIDQHGHHLHIIPAEVKGFFRRHRSRVQWILLVVFLALPWIHIQQKQIVLLNIPGREFIFLGATFKAHDAPLVFLLIAIATLSLALVTSIWGRIWCGWACPQTVFIDAIYRKIEFWTEGNYRERRQMQSASWSFYYLRKKFLKWFLFFLVSALFSHSFAAYFVGSHKLVQMIQGAPSENWNYFLIISSVTLLLVFNFGWFREQFCVIMCPYGRIQSVILEPSSLAVVYDDQRGEPRKNLSALKQGDCVSCNRCVEVCPTGIDIRNGLQMECIACTACIDACDEIMKRVNKPPGLISYRTLDNTPLKVIKLKTMTYFILIILALLTLIYNLKTRSSFEATILRGIDTPYSQDRDNLGQPRIINHFRLQLHSQSEIEIPCELILSEEAKNQGLTLMTSPSTIILKPYGSETWHLFFHLPKKNLPQNGQLNFSIKIKSPNEEILTKNLTFLGPTL